MRESILIALLLVPVACAHNAPDAGTAKPQDGHQVSIANVMSGTPVGYAKNAWDEDVPRKSELDQSGTAAVGTHVVLRVPAGSMSVEQLNDTANELDRGIAALKQFVGAPAWNCGDDTRIYFYCPDEQFISHAPGGNCVFIPLWRMKDKQSPWVHECVHLLVNSEGGDWLAGDQEYAQKRMPLWLIEGLADAVAMEVCKKEQLTYFSPLMETSIDTVDQEAVKALRDGPAKAVLDKVGGRGRLAELFGPDRVRYAVPFYAASASLVHFIAKEHGYQPLIAAVRKYDNELETLEAATGSEMDSIRAQWLKSIGYLTK